MALKPQNIPVTFSGGLDQKTATQLVVPGKFLVLENCVRRKMGRIEKRRGFEALGTGTVNRPAPYADVDVSSGRKLATREDELVLIDDTSIYAYSQSGDNLIYRGEAPALDIDVYPVTRNSHRQAMPDGDRMSGVFVSAWEDSRGGVRCSVYDYGTGSSLMYDSEVSATGTRPRVVRIKDSVLIVYREGTELKWKRIDKADPTAFAASSSASWVTSVADVAFDIHSTGDYAVMSVNKTDTSIFVTYINQDGDLGTGANGLPNTSSIAAGTANVNGSSIYCDTVLNQKYVYVMHMGTAVKVTAFNALLTIQSTASLSGSANARNVTGILQDGGTSFDVVWEAYSTTSAVYKGEVQFDGTTLTATVAGTLVAQGLGLISKAFESTTGVYMVSAFQSSVQATYFVLRLDGLVVGQIAQGLGDGYTRSSASPGALRSGLSRVHLDDNGLHQTQVVVTGKVQADAGGSIQSISKGIQRCNLDFSGAISTPIEAGRSLIIPGGINTLYDGVSPVEAGFFTFPEMTAALVTGGTGTFTTGYYYYAAIYEWVDAQGQVHRSAPSVIQSVNVDVATKEVTLTIPSYRFTTKRASQGRADVVVAIYRNATAGQSSVLYRLHELTNTPDTATISYTDTNSLGSGLDLREILYTTGDVVENIAPPASKVAITHKNRVFLAGLEQPGKVAFSKEIVDGEAVAFSDTFTIQADGSRGGITALGPLDDKIVLFKKDGILGVVGDGPLDTGAQNTFTLPQKVSGDVGCENQDSILEIPTGLMFKSDKGIYLLDRSLGASYIGAPVEDYNSYRITSAVLVEDSNEARFTTEDGPSLVYNYLFDQWSVFTNYDAAHAINGLGSYLHLKSDGRIMKENSGYLDSGSRIQMNIETSWLALANLQGYQRVYEYEFLGDFVSDHVTRVKLYYDYETYSSQTVYFNAGSVLELSTYGDDAVYGNTVYGGVGSTVYQFYSKPRRQKCKAIKFRIEELDTITSAGGGSFNLVSLVLRVGMKDGLASNSKAGEI